MLVSLRDGRLESVALVDPDASTELSPTTSDASIIAQLEVIFINFDGHPFFRVLFNEGNGRLRSRFTNFDVVLLACVAPMPAPRDDISTSAAPAKKQRVTMPRLPSMSWDHMVAAPIEARSTLTSALDLHLTQWAGSPKQDILLGYMIRLPHDHTLSLLTKADLAYMFFTEQNGMSPSDL